MAYLNYKMFKLGESNHEMCKIMVYPSYEMFKSWCITAYH